MNHQKKSARTRAPRPRGTGAPRPQGASAQHPRGPGTPRPSGARPPAFAGQRSAASSSAVSFVQILQGLLRERASEEGEASYEHEPLAHLGYSDEVSLKEEALRRFWQAHRLDGSPEALVLSPKPRRYRTSSKRRVGVRNGVVSLFLGDHASAGQKKTFVASPLEPAEHAKIYHGLADRLNTPSYRSLAAHLNYLIVRGSYAQRALIFNVDELSAPIVRKIKMLAGEGEGLGLSSCFIYLDPSRSNYHFESRRPDEAVTFKRVSGPDQLLASFHGCRYRYHPTSFSQINESIVPDLMERARELLAPSGDERLLDLYCGYGLFSHYLAPSYTAVVGVDVEGPAIRAAGANSQLNPCAATRKFIGARIERDFVTRSLHRPGSREVVLLDPPRNGPQHGVINALGQRNPLKVLHVFCDIEQIPPSLERWRGAGYRPNRIVALDMFPGSANLEVLILLTAGRGGPRS